MDAENVVIDHAFDEVELPTRSSAPKDLVKQDASKAGSSGGDGREDSISSGNPSVITRKRSEQQNEAAEADAHEHGDATAMIDRLVHHAEILTINGTQP